MFGFLKSREDDLGLLRQRMAEAQDEGDFSRLCPIYYQMACAYQKQGDEERAQLYLGRATAIFNNLDSVEIPEKLIDACDDLNGRLGLEEEPFCDGVSSQVDEKAEALSNRQRCLWGLLSLSRIIPLFARLSRLKGCEVLGDFDLIGDILLRVTYGRAEPADLYTVEALEDRFYEFENSEAFADARLRAPGPCGARFEIPDLNGMMLPTNLYLFLSQYSDLLGGEGDSVDVSFVPCTLLPDYYLRTQSGRLRDMPGIQAGLARIWEDYRFVLTDPSHEEMQERIRRYRSEKLPEWDEEAERL